MVKRKNVFTNLITYIKDRSIPVSLAIHILSPTSREETIILHTKDSGIELHVRRLREECFLQLTFENLSFSFASRPAGVTSEVKSAASTVTIFTFEVNVVSKAVF